MYTELSQFLMSCVVIHLVDQNELFEKFISLFLTCFTYMYHVKKVCVCPIF